MFIEAAYAMGAPGNVGAQQQGGGGASFMLMLIIMFAIFYFILIRPQQKKMKEHKRMVDELKKGDRIVTAGGIYGTVEAVTPNTLTVKIAEGTKVKITRHSIGAVIKAEEEEKE